MKKKKKSFSGSLIPNLRVIILDFKINNNENVCGGAISFVKEKKKNRNRTRGNSFLSSLSFSFFSPENKTVSFLAYGNTLFLRVY